LDLLLLREVRTCAVGSAHSCNQNDNYTLYDGVRTSCNERACCALHAVQRGANATAITTAAAAAVTAAQQLQLRLVGAQDVRHLRHKRRRNGGVMTLNHNRHESVRTVNHAVQDSTFA
jgi:hypothetical protein